ncbi:MAG: bifunctional DNA primase/polymerase [bacterium]|nr:bifunctional DNA primase/polymerase [bacterium]
MNNPNYDAYDAAVNYLGKGWSVIPIDQDKRPLVAWQEFQTRRAGMDEIKAWFKQWPNLNIGIVTGTISGIVAVDVEKDGSTDGLPPTVMAKSGGGGWHFYYRHPGLLVKTEARVRELTDIRGDGGYVIAPPSLHASGNRYEWMVGPGDTDLADLPEWVLNQNQNYAGQKDWHQIAAGANLGVRNQTAASYVGKLLHDLSTELWASAGWDVICAWNERNKPPLPIKELRDTFDSIARTEMQRRTNGSPQTDEAPQFEPIKLSELMAKKFPEQKWIVEKLVPAEGITIIAGHPKSGKTWFALDVAKSVANGDPLFGKFATHKAPVLIIDEENGEGLLQERFAMLQSNPALPIFLLSYSNYKLDDRIEQTISFAKTNGIKLAIFDSLVRVHRGEENSATEVAQTFGLFRKLCKEGITVLILHHNRKDGRLKGRPDQAIRGSSDILAAVHSLIAIDREEKYSLLVTQVKLRNAEETNPFRLNIIVSDKKFWEFSFAGEVEESVSKKLAIKEAIKSILSEQSPVLYKKELFEAILGEELQVGYKTFAEAVKEMVEAGELFELRGEKNKVFCSLQPFDENPPEVEVISIDE